MTQPDKILPICRVSGCYVPRGVTYAALLLCGECHVPSPSLSSDRDRGFTNCQGWCWLASLLAPIRGGGNSSLGCAALVLAISTRCNDRSPILASAAAR